MAKFNNGILGPLQGAIGPVVASSWKGKPLLKALPRKRTKKSKGDEKLNQSKFSQSHYWLQPLLEFVRVGFKKYAEKVEGFNAAKSYALNNAFRGEGKNKTIDPSLVMVSYGNLPLPSFIHVNQKKPNTLEFDWDPAYAENGNPDDQVMLLGKRSDAVMKLTGQFRYVGKDILTLAPSRGNTYYIYAAFTAHDRSNQSNSVYLGMITT